MSQSGIVVYTAIVIGLMMLSFLILYIKDVCDSEYKRGKKHGIGLAMNVNQLSNYVQGASFQVIAIHGGKYLEVCLPRRDKPGCSASYFIEFDKEKLRGVNPPGIGRISALGRLIMADTHDM